jgi:hypothetical protein
MACGTWSQLGNLFICARELFFRAPDLFTSLLECCDRGIVRISLFRVRHGIHLALLALLWKSCFAEIDVNADAKFDPLDLRHIDILFGHGALNFDGAARTASTTLPNSARAPSPVFLTMRPR